MCFNSHRQWYLGRGKVGYGMSGPSNRVRRIGVAKMNRKREM